MTGYKGFYLVNKVGRYKAFSLPKLYTLSVGLSLWEAFPLNYAPLSDRSLTRNGLLHWVSLTPTVVPLGSVNKLREMFIWLGLVRGGVQISPVGGRSLGKQGFCKKIMSSHSFSFCWFCATNTMKYKWTGWIIYWSHFQYLWIFWVYRYKRYIWEWHVLL